jgi:hypothetical protein
MVFSEGGTSATLAANAAHNLPFVHACAVLNDVLEQLSDEGHFQCKTFRLGALLDKSENRLPWQDFQTIKNAVSRRNDIAHHGDVIPRAECWRFIDAIRAELVSWKILTPGGRVLTKPKVTINVKKVQGEGGTDYWIVVEECSVRAGMDTVDSRPDAFHFKSGEWFQTRDQAVEEMKRRARKPLER